MALEKRVSLRQVAQKLGVSPSTVSRALRDSPEISEETKRRVRQALIEMTGSAGLPSRGVKQALRDVAVLISRPLRSLTSDEFFAQVINGVVSCAESAGCHVLLSPIDAGGDWVPPRILENRRVDALIVGGISISPAYREGLSKLSVPVVYIGKHQDEPDNHAVIPDNVRGGRLVAEHLVACGYERFLYLGGGLDTFVFRDRLEGFRQGLAQHGFRLRAADVVSAAGIDRVGGYEAVKGLLGQMGEEFGRERLGIFAATDWMAAGALQALLEARIGVPDPVGIVGYSDLELASHVCPPLTTVRVDAYALGYLAFRLVEEIWAGRVTMSTQIWMQPRLVVRSTTAGAREAEHVMEKEASSGA